VIEKYEQYLKDKASLVCLAEIIKYRFLGLLKEIFKTIKMRSFAVGFALEQKETLEGIIKEYNFYQESLDK